MSEDLEQRLQRMADYPDDRKARHFSPVAVEMAAALKGTNA